MSDLLLRRDEGSISYLELNAPACLNAMSDEMLCALQDAFDNLATDNLIRVIVISGAGKAFCAGHDLREMTKAREAKDGGKAYFSDFFTRCSKMMLTIRELSQPVIAKVNGIATAAGCQLVASCDMAIAADTAQFSVNGINIGLFCSTPMVALTRNILTKKAFEMLTTGRLLCADEAVEWGLINRSVRPDMLDTETQALAKTLAEKHKGTLKIGKKAFYEQLEKPISAAYEYTGQVIVENMLQSDTVEGINAFIEKRAPRWE